ncbi:MAG: ATP-binding protein [Bacteroidia bacterium]|nr:ATP-binding protein [Bacteroidia bacterium]MDW8158946.1 ATP-binding protein [Bacteroidia bacterium]
MESLIKAHTSKKYYIICVDDHREVLDTLEAQLSSRLPKNYKYELAESGEEALEILQDLYQENEEIPVIISDQAMPGGMSGDVFLKKAHQIVPRTRKIMLTGQGEMKNIESATREAQLFRLILKPWEMEDMVLTVEQAINAYFMEAAIEEQNKTLKHLYESTELITQETDFDLLVGKLLNIMLQYSQAEKVWLINTKEEKPLLIASICASQEPQLNLNQTIIDSADYPYGALMEVLRKKEALVYEDAETQNGETYFKNQKSKSVAIVPTFQRGNMNYIFYFESKSITGLFSLSKLEIINILTSTASIALENAVLYDSMENLVIERTQEVFETNRKLTQVNAYKDQMINIVSHDIRSPLSGILNLAQLMQDKEIASNPSQVIRNCQIIQNSADTVIKFVNDILDLAKLESGTMTLNKTTIDLDSYLKNIITSFEALTLTKGVKLELQSKGELKIKADSTTLAQAFNNLIANAIKFTPKGGRVTVGLNSIEQNGKPFAQITVEDTGIGIPKEALPTIFEKLNKYQRSGTKGEKGTGFGLSIAKQVIELHNGTITVDSEENKDITQKGTTFTILLPID